MFRSSNFNSTFEHDVSMMGTFFDRYSDFDRTEKYITIIKNNDIGLIKDQIILLDPVHLINSLFVSVKYNQFEMLRYLFSIYRSRNYPMELRFVEGKPVSSITVQLIRTSVQYGHTEMLKKLIKLLQYSNGLDEDKAGLLFYATYFREYNNVNKIKEMMDYLVHTLGCSISSDFLFYCLNEYDDNIYYQRLPLDSLMQEVVLSYSSLEQVKRVIDLINANMEVTLVITIPLIDVVNGYQNREGNTVFTTVLSTINQFNQLIPEELDQNVEMDIPALKELQSRTRSDLISKLTRAYQQKVVIKNSNLRFFNNTKLNQDVTSVIGRFLGKKRGTCKSRKRGVMKSKKRGVMKSKKRGTCKMNV
jgi:hypothetical protein